MVLPDQPPPYEATQHKNSAYPQHGNPPATYPHPENPQSIYPHPETPSTYPHPENPQQPHSEKPEMERPQAYPQPGHPQMAFAQMPQNPQAPPVTFLVQASVPSRLGPKACIITCPSCHHQITTRIETKSSSTKHLWALILCVLGCWPCCLIPYCMDSCMNTDHYCPSCNAYLGTYKDD